MDRYFSAEQFLCHEHFYSMLDTLQSIVIPEDTRFWMLRTQKGYFYNEFTADEFVALGWNTIDRGTSFSKDNIPLLKADLQLKYEGIGRPMTAINKCITFMHSVKPGDYILIPSEGTREVTIALAGDYFEDASATFATEIEAIKKIKDSASVVEDILCPYKKRRKIIPLITLPSYKLHHRLLRGISNYHGISNLDEYAHFILSAVYPTYCFAGKSVITLWSAQTEPIGPRALSGLLYHSTNYCCRFVDEKSLSTKVNLNSAGPIQFIIENLAENYPEYVTMFLIVSGLGITASNCDKIPDLLKGLLSLPADVFDKYASSAHKLKEFSQQNRSAALDNDLKEVELIGKKLELIEKIKASGINPEALEGDLIGIAKCAAEMKVDPPKGVSPMPTAAINPSAGTPSVDSETSPSLQETR